MKEVLQYLYDNCSYESHIRESEGELWFFIGRLCVILELSSFENIITDKLDDFFSIDEIDVDIITNICSFYNIRILQNISNCEG